MALSPKNDPSQRPVVAHKRGTPTLTPTLKPFFYRLEALAGPGVIGGVATTWPEVATKKIGTFRKNL